MQQSHPNPSASQYGVSSRGIRNDSEGISAITFGGRTESRKDTAGRPLQGLSDEQCEREGATCFGSVLDVLSEIVTEEFLVLNGM